MYEKIVAFKDVGVPYVSFPDFQEPKVILACVDSAEQKRTLSHESLVVFVEDSRHFHLDVTAELNEVCGRLDPHLPLTRLVLVALRGGVLFLGVILLLFYLNNKL